jgi:hypothetical protein
LGAGVSNAFGGKRVWLDSGMANRGGRSKRPVGVGATATKSTVRLTPTAWQVAEDAASALRVSRDAYLDRLLAREAANLDKTGRPLWWDEPVPADQAMLPLDLDEEAPLKSA